MMHEENDRGQFEFFLQDSLKDFRMVPASQVWRSLYNNLHPSRRWPAFSTMVLFICCLSFFDRNHQSIPIEGSTFLNKTNSIHHSSSIPDEPAIAGIDQEQKTTEHNQAARLFNEQGYKKKHWRFIEPSDNLPSEQSKYEESNILMTFAWIDPRRNHMEDLSINHPSPVFKSIKRVQPDSIEHPLKSIAEHKTNKKDNKFSIAYTFAPSVGYRHLRQVSTTTDQFPVNASFGVDLSDFYQKPAMNMEVGVSLQYKLHNKISLIGGLQLNYMGYRIEATEWEQPIQTELEYVDPNTGEIRLLSATSTLAKVTKGDKIRRNYSVDLSIPIGLSLAVVDEKKWQCRIQGTLQPGLKLSDKTALISANQSSYIYEPRMINEWSLHAGLAALVVLPVDDNLHFSFGPSVRYQLSRQFQSSYVYRENRYNTGMTISLLKSL
jgi:hypothetical protein